MLYLLETPVGMAIFKKTDQMTIISKLKYSSSAEAIEAMSNLNSLSKIPQQIEDFIRANVQAASELNVLSEDFAQFLKSNYKINAFCRPDNDFRNLKKNPFKWFDVNKDVYNAMVLRVAHKMSNEDQSDAALINTLDTIEELDKSINNRVMRIRDWYSLHFPELNLVKDNQQYLKYLLEIGNRSEYVKRVPTEEMPDDVRNYISNSMGTDMAEEDINKIIENTKDILKSIESKNTLSSYLLVKCKKSFPNMYFLIGEILTAKLLRKAGSISSLSVMPASTLQILGAEKAYNEAIKSGGNTPKYGIIFSASILFQTPDELKGKMARKLASKIALCAKVDAQRDLQDGSFGREVLASIENSLEKMDVPRKSDKKQIVQKKRKIVSVAEYDQSKDTKKSKN